MKKNVASQKIGVEMVSATDGSAFTGSVTVAVTGDAGTQATGSVGSGACTHEGNGYHTYAPAQAETNYDLIAFTFTGTGAVPATVQIFTTFPQTGDNFARLGAPAGASVSADIAAAKTVVDAIKAKTDQMVFTIANKLDSSIQAAGDFAQGAADKVWATATRLLTAGTNIVLAKGTGITGFNDLSAAAVNAEVDTALSDYDGPTNADLATALAAADDAVLAEVALVRAKTDNLPAAPAATGDIPTAASIADAVWDEAIADHAGAGSTGEALDDAGAAGTPPTVEEIRAEMDANSTKLDVAVGTRLATSGYTAPPTAVQNADALLARNQQGGSNNAPTVSTALAGGLGLITISGGVMTVKNGDGTTAFTRTVTREELDAIVGLA